MTDRREHRRLCPSIDAQLDGISMTPSERAEARHALELGTRAAGLIMATTSGLKWLVRVPVPRRAGRKAAPTAKRSGGAPAAQASTVLRRDPQSAS
jgi:hypothetical protein